jgi:hypothetical protein
LRLAHIPAKWTRFANKNMRQPKKERAWNSKQGRCQRKDAVDGIAVTAGVGAATPQARKAADFQTHPSLSGDKAFIEVTEGQRRSRRRKVALRLWDLAADSERMSNRR